VSFTDEFQLQAAFEQMRQERDAAVRKAEELHGVHYRLLSVQAEVEELQVLLARERKFGADVVTAYKDPITLDAVVQQYLRDHQAD